MPGVSGSNSIYNGNTFSVFPKTPHLSDLPAGKSTGLAQLFQLDFQISELSDSELLSQRNAGSTTELRVPLVYPVEFRLDGL